MAKATNPTFIPKRGRPTKQQVEAIDRAIVETAGRLFLQTGNYDGVTMDAVAFVTGIAKGTLYSRYPSKDALFLDVVQDRLDDWGRQPIMTLDLPLNDVAGRLRAHARNLVVAVTNPDVRALSRVILSTGGQFPNVSQMMAEQGFERMIARIALDLVDASDSQYRNPRLVAVTLASAIIGFQMQTEPLGDASLRSLTSFADQLVELLIAGKDGW